MKPMKRLLLFLLILVPCVLSAAEPYPFFEEHCVKCHGAEKQKGDLRLDTLTWNPADLANLEIWQEIADRLDLDEMPPEDEPRLAPAVLEPFRAQLTEHLAASTSHHTKQVVLRRLNRAQYRNTLRDLLHIDTFVEDPTEAFPADDEEEGFDNLGETLQMSDFLLRQYLKVARAAVDQATFEGERPGAETYAFRDKKARVKNFSVQGNDPDREEAFLYLNDERAPGDPRGMSIINSREGATHDGWYEISFDLESSGRGNFAEGIASSENRDDYQVYRPGDLHRFEIYLTAPNSKSQIQTRPRHLLAAIDLPDNERLTTARRFWLPKEWRIEVGFGNGFGYNSTTLLPILDPDFDKDAYEALSNSEKRAFASKTLPGMIHDLDFPRIIVHDITETGPHYEQWPPRSHETVFGQPGQDDVDIVRTFAQRAFRRPVTEDEIAPYLKLAATSPEGIRTAIEAILCSPRFLYLYESEGQLDDHSIASRLCYFLWNTMPDDVLLADAAAGRLHDPAVLENHLERMLADPRSDDFVDSFIWSWLRLDNTVEMAPDPMKFYEYHRNRIDKAMVEESTRFFRALLTENLPIGTFLDSDFAFLNADLVRHYGLQAKINTTAKFQRVSLTGAPHRGGLLGQASVLTASANGVDTSPVIRGIWILENLLGTPPSPPPDNVEVPEPDTRGELTLRQIYAKHRTVESCNDCHKEIDPLGFALENYDAIGAWRTEYESGNPVNPSGRMPGGEEFEDARGLKQIMVRDHQLFSRNLTTKLLTYATGRKMEAGDRPAIDAIIDELHQEEGGLHDLLKLLVTSETFLSK
jgi:hypothetical protein